jgi:hypothetical protein
MSDYAVGDTLWVRLKIGLKELVVIKCRK